jgi:hypothetical protein
MVKGLGHRQCPREIARLSTPTVGNAGNTRVLARVLGALHTRHQSEQWKPKKAILIMAPAFDEQAATQEQNATSVAHPGLWYAICAVGPTAIDME